MTDGSGATYNKSRVVAGGIGREIRDAGWYFDDALARALAGAIGAEHPDDLVPRTRGAGAVVEIGPWA